MSIAIYWPIFGWVVTSSFDVDFLDVSFDSLHNGIKPLLPFVFQFITNLVSVYGVDHF